MDNKLNEAREKINRIDKEMARLFVERMKAAEDVAEYKKEHGLEILDPAREAEIIRNNSEYVDNNTHREYYVNFQKNTMSLSRAYQSRLITEMRAADSGVTTLNVNLGERSYPITVGHDLISSANEYFDLDRKVFIITDSGVPCRYAEALRSVCKSATVYTVAEGEGSKSLSTLEAVLTAIADAELGRSDCVVAVGGGVVGDLAGFAASIYMRGIDFYNVPTTLLSQVDSSIGGKTAVNLGGIKNIVGAFKQPKGVIVDTDTLRTLPERHLMSGLCEAIKMAATSDAELFGKIESLDKADIYNSIEEIIVGALRIKKHVVENDECEKGLRRILNFGHTLGHGIEADAGLGRLYHGECVAIGMIPVSFGEAHERLLKVLKKVGLPTEYHGNIESALGYVIHDKKCSGGVISVIVSEKIGTYEIKSMSVDEFKNLVLNIK